MPIIPLEELKNRVVGGSVGAISIDTSVFEHYRFGFESGVLAQLTQFGRVDVEHLLVDTILHEIRSHLVVQADLVRAHFKNAMKPLGDAWDVDKVIRDDVFKILFEDQASSARTDARLEKFLSDSFAVPISSAEYVNVADVLALYFETKPPFANKEAKKNEFPDAFTLLALEGWAKKNDTHILVVSKDGDWRRFCGDSEHLFLLDDLPQALSVFHGGAEEAADLLQNALKSGAVPELDDLVIDAVNSQVDKIDVSLDANSNWHYEEELVEAHVLATNGFSEQLSNFEVIDYANNQLQVRSSLVAEIAAQFVVNFNHWDGIDREYIAFGSASLEGTEEVELEVIVTVEFSNGRVSIEKVELLPSHLTMDFGEIEPDWMGAEREDEE